MKRCFLPQSARDFPSADRAALDSRGAAIGYELQGRLDLLVGDSFIMELKAIDALAPIHIFRSCPPLGALGVLAV
ncbi:MAG: hypothetical protein QM518_09335 [Verrucomicrobiota bacterium]|nr:hypothetical protein [Verrucomicrobiota bacterium]